MEKQQNISQNVREPKTGVLLNRAQYKDMRYSLAGSQLVGDTVAVLNASHFVRGCMSEVKVKCI